MLTKSHDNTNESLRLGLNMVFRVKAWVVPMFRYWLVCPERPVVAPVYFCEEDKAISDQFSFSVQRGEWFFSLLSYFIRQMITVASQLSYLFHQLIIFASQLRYLFCQIIAFVSRFGYLFHRIIAFASSQKHFFQRINRKVDAQKYFSQQINAETVEQKHFSEEINRKASLQKQLFSQINTRNWKMSYKLALNMHKTNSLLSSRHCQAKRFYYQAFRSLTLKKKEKKVGKNPTRRVNYE
ncbi:MAG: hypothetical protein GY757_54810 [bacterium]|nr:hypothetical protein [bacterium]